MRPLIAPARVLPAILVAMSAAAPAAADMPPSGATSCSGCHAPAGAESPVPGFSGRSADEIAAALLAFRAGERPATVMDRIAKGFSEEEIRAIAAWLAVQREPTP